MASPLSLTVQPRTPESTRAKDLLKEGRVPGVLYGFGIENQPIEFAEKAFHKVYVSAGESTVIDLTVDANTLQVLIHQVDLDPVSNAYCHVDFFAPNMNKEVTAKIPLLITGEAPGVKDLGGVLVHSRDTVTVTCLPKDLPHDITVDISTLEQFHDSITVANLSIPSGVRVHESDDEFIVMIQPPRKEEEEVKPEVAEGEEGAVAEGEEGEGEKKEEGAKGADDKK